MDKKLTKSENSFPIIFSGGSPILYPTVANVSMQGCNNQVCQFRRSVRTPVDISTGSSRPFGKLFASLEVLRGGSWVLLAKDTSICEILVAGECPPAAQITWRYRVNISSVPVGTRSQLRIKAYSDQGQLSNCVRINFVAIN